MMKQFSSYFLEVETTQQSLKRVSPMNFWGSLVPWALCLVSGQDCRFGERPPVAKALMEELFLGDPMTTFEAEPLDAENWHGMTHISDLDVELVLSAAPKPVTFWLELGSFEGGSAIRTMQTILAQNLNVSVVAADTFLGDSRVLWEEPEHKRKLLRPDGTISLYNRFRGNVHRHGLQACILPLQATSVVTLKLMVSLAERKISPLPQIIYLDSAHEEGEVLLELQLAWKALVPGGILFGDDWVLEATENDVLKFATSVKDHLDDQWARNQHIRVLGRVRPGLFISYLSNQWFMKKLAEPSIESSPKEIVNTAAYDCWSGRFAEELCCDVARFGPEGNIFCWDLVFTFERCCVSR